MNPLNSRESYWNLMAPVYMPMEQVKRRVVPAFLAGIFITVSPVAGRTFWRFNEGIIKAREQDRVFLVVNPFLATISLPEVLLSLGVAVLGGALGSWFVARRAASIKPAVALR